MSELIMTVNVTTYEAKTMAGKHSKVVMIPFSAEATGKYFNGSTITNGIDTQISARNRFSLSARYMLEGTDRCGKKCKLFIENNGTSLNDCRPTIYTDSEELAFLENAALTANVECIENGVIVSIFLHP